MAIDTAIIVGAIVGARAILVAAGVDGMTLSPLTSSIVAGGVFVMGLVVASPPTTSSGCGRSSLFLLTEFVVHAHAAEEGVAAADVEAQAEEVEELLSDVEEQEGDVTEVADLADQPSSAAND